MPRPKFVLLMTSGESSPDIMNIQKDYSISSDVKTKLTASVVVKACFKVSIQNICEIHVNPIL